MSIGTNTPSGFAPSNITNTGNSTFVTMQYNINPANTTPIGIGDCVVFDASGYVTVATAGASLLGVLQGVTYSGTNQPVILTPNTTYWTGAAAGQTQIIANVYVDTSIDFVAQLSGAGVTQAFLGTNPYCNLLAGTISATGQSGMTIDSGSFSSSPTGKQFKFVGLAPTPSGATQNAYGVQYNLGLFRLINAYMNS